MAQKLHSEYGYSYDNVKVLLGGWNTWLENNATDPTAYPISNNPGAKATVAAQETQVASTPVAP